MAFQKPLIYVKRPYFEEEKGLLNHLMHPYGRSLEMPRHDFDQGKWSDYILQADQLPLPTNKIASNGHVEAADTMESLFFTK